MRFTFLALPIIMAAPSYGSELPAVMMAKFIKIIAGDNGVACKDSNLAKELAALGVKVTPSGKLLYAATEGEVAAGKAAGKLVICPDLSLLPKGGTLAIVEEGGKPQIYLHMGNLAASGVTVSDAILKIGKKL